VREPEPGCQVSLARLVRGSPEVPWVLLRADPGPRYRATGRGGDRQDARSPAAPASPQDPPPPPPVGARGAYQSGTDDEQSTGNLLHPPSRT